MHDLFRGLPRRVREPLRSPPADEKALLELALDWPGLRGLEARVAVRLWVFLLTWDPLAWLGDRGAGWATATGNGDAYEIVLYLPLESVLAHARMLETTVAGSLALWGESVIAAAVRREPLLVSGAYAELAAEGKAPGLLSEPRAERAWELPAIRLASSGWEPIGLGAIQDLAQGAFGPVDLDRSSVRLEPAARSDRRCPACAGAGFGFPAELEEKREVMCPAHRAQAEQVRNVRLARAAASNPEGWAAIVEASARLERPSRGIPLGLLGRLDAVSERDPRRRLSGEELRADAELALALAAHFAGRPQAFADFQFEDELFTGDWLIELPFALAAEGLVDEAVRVGDAYAELWEENGSLFASDAAVILAQAGRAAESLARVEQNLRRFPNDLWTRIHAGDVHRELGDETRAESAYREAAELAIERDEPDAAAGAWERLAELLRGRRGRRAEARDAALEAEAEAEAWRAAGYDDDELVFGDDLLFEESFRAAKVGRNEPCPCGSGRKYKRCCGA